MGSLAQQSHAVREAIHLRVVIALAPCQLFSVCVICINMDYFIFYYGFLLLVDCQLAFIAPSQHSYYHSFNTGRPVRYDEFAQCLQRYVQEGLVEYVPNWESTLRNISQVLIGGLYQSRWHRPCVI